MKSIAIVLWCLLVAQWTYGQQKLTGTVKDENGEVLPGVNVLIKGTGLGTATLVDGTYSLTVTGKETLVFSYVGYETRELNVDNRTVLDVVLKQEIEDMDEVVITAIGIKQQKKKIGYSTELVDGGVLSQIPAVNAAMSLAGQVAGLQVSSPTGIFQTPEFELRGKTPLIVVDGVPVETDFFDISSANIESINVLKGTAASALYGARGKDGALLITTKSAGYITEMYFLHFLFSLLYHSDDRRPSESIILFMSDTSCFRMNSLSAISPPSLPALLCPFRLR